MERSTPPVRQMPAVYPTVQPAPVEEVYVKPPVRVIQPEVVYQEMHTAPCKCSEKFAGYEERISMLEQMVDEIPNQQVIVDQTAVAELEQFRAEKVRNEQSKLMEERIREEIRMEERKREEIRMMEERKREEERMMEERKREEERMMEKRIREEIRMEERRYEEPRIREERRYDEPIREAYRVPLVEAPLRERECDRDFERDRGFDRDREREFGFGEASGREAAFDREKAYAEAADHEYGKRKVYEKEKYEKERLEKDKFKKDKFEKEKYEREHFELQEVFKKVAVEIERNRGHELVRNIDDFYICGRRRKVVVKLKIKEKRHEALFRRLICGDDRIIFE